MTGAILAVDYTTVIVAAVTSAFACAASIVSAFFAYKAQRGVKDNLSTSNGHTVGELVEETHKAVSTVGDESIGELVERAVPPNGPEVESEGHA